MSQLYVSSDSNEGFVYERDDAGNLTTEIDEDVAFNRRAVVINYRRSTHVIGTFARPWVRDRFGSYHRAGVRAPLTKPTLADGAFASGSKGNMIGYQTFAMKTGNVWIAESNPGPATLTLDAAGTGRLWDNLDWSPADPHVTHSRGYVSVDGSFPALAWERPISAAGTTVTENVGTSALGVTLPVRKGLDQGYSVDLYARGIPPYTRYAEEYKDTFFYAGDPLHPERIYYSKVFEPESVNTTPITTNGRTDIPWLETTDGSRVTGLKKQGDELIVGTFRGIDRIQGYSYGDYAIHRINNYWGVVSHFSMAICGPQDSLFFLSPQGPTIYNAGSFRYIGDPIQSWWRDWFRTNPVLAQDAFGVEDRFWETYNLLLPQSDSSSLYLVVDFNTAESGRPIWTMDYRARKDWVSGELVVDEDADYYERYTGSCDGKVRQENVLTDADDDGDTYQKKFTVQSPHRYMGDQAGDEAHGYVFHPLDLYLKHDTNSAVMSLYAGEDPAPPEAGPFGIGAVNAVTPHWTNTEAKTEVETGARPRTARTSEHHSTNEVSGKGVTLLVEVTAPLDVEYRGWAIGYREGPASKQPFKV
jgi:hypothetical protein